MSDKSLKDKPSVVTKALNSISIIVLGHLYGFYGQRRRGRRGLM